MKNALIVVLLLVVIGLVAYILIPPGEDVARSLDQAGTGQVKQPTVIEPSAAGISYDLSADNTKIAFSCAKDVAGKTLTVHGGWSGRFGSKLTGKVLADEEHQQLLQIEAQIDVGSLWSEHDQLTDALLTKGFFDVEQHPTATFISTSIEEGAPEGSALEGATHKIEGNFSLNGIEKSITFPAKIELAESQLKLDSQFSLDRKDFEVNFTDTAGFGLLTDENISHLVALKLNIDAAAAAAGDTGTAVATTDQPDNGTDEPADTIDISKLPQTYTETIPATQVPFEMVLVAGDAEQDVAPLYFGKHEVTWNEFMPWVEGQDIEDQDEMGELRALKLRPSPPYGAVDRNFGMDTRPALGLSRLSAELYCKWLSEQTGKAYRLPTEKEWLHAYTAGGGDAEQPLDAEAAKRLAVFEDNSWDDSIGDWATKPVGSSEPNSLGLVDMAGNVCEWVMDTGEDRVARGGHFEGPLEELGLGRHVEDADEWNRDYPNEPKSIWWFVNARWVGFRVVSDVAGPESSEARLSPLRSNCPTMILPAEDEAK